MSGIAVTKTRTGHALSCQMGFSEVHGQIYIHVSVIMSA